MYSLFPTKSNRFAVTMMASSTASPSQGNALSSSPSLGSQPTENLAPPGRPSLEERSLSAASVASAAPSSASVSAGEESLPRPGHNWANPNRRAARGSVLGGAVSGVVVGSRPRPSLSGGVLAVPYLPFSLPPVLPGPVSPPAPTRPAPPAPPSRPPPAVPSSPAIPARNPARLGPASPAPSGSARDDKKTHGVKKEEK
ncbi:hypothetical protein QC763_305428 [Podospora pseudopauciseta]|uniref:Uncharacterized protein n=1 Tax=Podospora pseudopauciseta TaxID=2093780 RepID=A0ABR0HGN0_9PEZI|nr:hypothetical protein QC763_305428 [Podospora pseudopauciseta]